MPTVTLAQGTTVSIAQTYLTSKNMTAVTNATSPVATLEASHGVTANDIIEIITSGWGRFNQRVFKATAVATNDVTIGSSQIDTTSTTFFPAGSGVGTIKEISAWTPITGIREVAYSGGEMQKADITTLDDVISKEIPTIESASSFVFTVIDDTTQTYVSVVTGYADVNALAAIQFAFPNGKFVYATGYWAIQRTPNIALATPLTVKITFSLANRSTRV